MLIFRGVPKIMVWKMISDFKHGVILGIYIRFQGGTHYSLLLMDEIRGIHHLDVQEKHVVNNGKNTIYQLVL